MSGINISYGITNQIGKGAGEINFFDEPINKTASLADMIAGEVVNEIIENALDIAVRASETSLQLNNDIPDEELCDDLNVNSMCTDIIENIVDSVTSQPSPNLTDIFEGLNSISVNNTDQNEEETLSLDLQLKKLLKDMMQSPCNIVNYDNIPNQDGVGDQPRNYLGEEKAGMETEVNRVVEKKSRVTDLVKNSPQLITEYLMMDDISRDNQSQWEESEEQIVQVIELDCVMQGNASFKARKTIQAEQVALPDDDDDDILPLPQCDSMDLVDLSPEAFKLEERQLTSSEAVFGGKGDDANMLMDMPESTQDDGDELVNNLNTTEQKSNDLTSGSNKKQSKIKKSKWNIGTRIRGFFKKCNKEQAKNVTETMPQ